jgi:RNA polymerase sigma factor (sigma-70 family)
MTDIALVERAVAGEEDAISQVIRSVEKGVFALALRMVPGGEAEDACQEALVKIVRGLPGFRGDSRFSTWAYAVASRSFLDYRRGRYREASYGVEELRDDLADGLDMTASARPEDRVYLGQVLVGCARALLQCLDGDHRLAYVLGHVMEFPTPEAAEISGVDEATYRKRLSRARDRISTALDGHCGVINPRASCRCARRLGKARALGRAGDALPPTGVDVEQLSAVIQEMNGLSARAAAYHQAEGEPRVPSDIVARVRALVRGHG